MQKRIYFPCIDGKQNCSGGPMKEFVSALTSKGRVTIPTEVREHLGITANGKVAFVIGDDGTVRLRVMHYPTVASLQGAAGSLKKTLSWQEMQQIACED